MGGPVCVCGIVGIGCVSMLHRLCPLPLQRIDSHKCTHSIHSASHSLPCHTCVTHVRTGYASMDYYTKCE